MRRYLFIPGMACGNTPFKNSHLGIQSQSSMRTISVIYRVEDAGTMNCHKCEKRLVAEEAHVHNGLFLCEDCYIDGVSLLKTCDPWAVYTASRTAAKGVTLTGEQQRVIDVLKEDEALSLERICSRLGLDEDEFRSHFSVLHHMGLVGACKKDEQIFFTLAAQKDTKK